MGLSIVTLQRDAILHTIRNTAPGEWKVLVLDEGSRRLIDNVVKEDDILNENITNIEQIELKRHVNHDIDAVYLLSSQPHIVDCLLADLDRRRYRKAHVVWTSLLDYQSRERIQTSPATKGQIAQFRELNIDFFPKESHLVTFRDPWSFPVLFHPACNALVKRHLEEVAHKIVAVCIVLGENPVIRYYRPRSPTHEAHVLCSHLARFVQAGLDRHAQLNESFRAPTNRPRGALFITDRSMDLNAPLIHEFTYQAMAYDLLPIRDGDKIFYKTVIHAGKPDQEEKDMEIGEHDQMWITHRHRHMKDTIESLMRDFRKFLEDHPQFTSGEEDATNLNTIKDMLAGLPEFQELKEAYALHLSMAQDCMNIFQNRKLPDLASVEQSLATGYDEEYRKPKNLADQIVRLLDDESSVPADRLRLIILYLLYKDGLVPGDTQKLLAHAQLPPQDGEVIYNLEHLGARIQKSLKDKSPPAPPPFGRKQPPQMLEDEYVLSRFEPAVKTMLDEHVKGTLDPALFPFTKPPLSTGEGIGAPDPLSQASLRSAKPTWAKSRLSSVEPRQRIIVFVAGGATYSESRACYHVSKATSREVVLVTSHMLTPSLFVRQVGDLSVDKRRLDIPMERPKPKPPAHLFEPDPPTPTAPRQAQPLPKTSVPATTAALSAMTINSSASNGAPPQQQPPQVLSKSKKEKEPGKKKKHLFFSSKK
ncbi:Sec1 family protein [Xylona heveae TC161]|uniref:Sec1 family protein n=1 Tax=Xylona heveae (strain CBS 132557 / TC161) TaxID=1328760 RepID=A0A165HB67_XYLHT|nr:Sec1 family protein [Xylona heveae TC161]KZF23244.1 Sec1 family protein [Xylona heveae TC161]